MLYHNVKEFGNAGGSLGKRCLFFLTVSYHEISLEIPRVNMQGNGKRNPKDTVQICMEMGDPTPKDTV